MPMLSSNHGRISNDERNYKLIIFGVFRRKLTGIHVTSYDYLTFKIELGGATSLSIMTFSIMTFSIMTFSITLKTIATLSKTALCIMTFYIACHYAECRK